MTPQLEDLVEEAYGLFQKYKVNSPLDVCTHCCVTDDEENRLASLVVRRIPQDLLTIYNDSAKPTQSDQKYLNEVKHFLPRYMELIAQFKYPSFTPELALSRLALFSNSDWTERELDLIQKFAEAFFQRCLHTYPVPDASLVNILIMFDKVDLDVDPMLGSWEEAHSAESAMHFCDLINHEIDFGKERKLVNSFAEDGLNMKIRNWLCKEGVTASFAKTIEGIILNPKEIQGDSLSSMSDAYEILESGVL